MKLITQIGILIILFLSNSVSNYIGIDLKGFTSIIVLLTVAIYTIRGHSITWLQHNFKNEFYIFKTAFLIMTVKLFTSDFIGIKHVFFFTIIPILFFIFFRIKVYNYSKMMRNSVLLFFILECLLSIYEFIYKVNIFPYDLIGDDLNVAAEIINQGEFRSSSFLGHPLLNAVVVSTILGFILISEMKILNKIFYFSLGLISILAFNARAAMLGFAFLSLFFVLKTIREKGSKNPVSLILIILIVLIISIIPVMIYDYGLGARIVKSKIFDESAVSRIKVFESFTFLDYYDLIIGNSSHYVLIMNKLKTGGVENSLIVIILNYGLILGSLIIYLFYYWVKRIISIFPKEKKIILIISFIMVGSTNNSLSSYIPWIVFALCMNAFLPIIKIKTLKV